MVSIDLRPAGGRRKDARRRRPKTMSLRRLQRERRGGGIRDDGGLVIIDDEAPKRRSECRGGQRPCPWVSCRYHLYLDVSETGAIKLNFPDREPWELDCSCALDVAEDRGGLTLDDVGELLNVTRERSRQIEVSALAKINVRLRDP
jgi:hypothetical protein